MGNNLVNNTIWNTRLKQASQLEIPLCFNASFSCLFYLDLSLYRVFKLFYLLWLYKYIYEIYKQINFLLFWFKLFACDMVNTFEFFWKFYIKYTYYFLQTMFKNNILSAFINQSFPNKSQSLNAILEECNPKVKHSFLLLPLLLMPCLNVLLYSRNYVPALSWLCSVCSRARRASTTYAAACLIKTTIGAWLKKSWAGRSSRSTSPNTAWNMIAYSISSIRAPYSGKAYSGWIRWAPDSILRTPVYL